MAEYPHRPFRKEPRQAVAEAGRKVYSTESPPSYDDDKTRSMVSALIEGATLREARASVALDGETQSLDKPTEETVTSKRKTYPRSIAQGATIDMLITDNAEVDVPFRSSDIWEWMDKDTRQEWMAAYGGFSATIDKIKKALANAAYAGRIRLAATGNDDGTWLYKGPGKGVSKVKRKPYVKPIVDPYVGKIVERPGEPYLSEYKLIGVLTDGRNLYKGPDGNIGTIEFVTLNPFNL